MGNISFSATFLYVLFCAVIFVVGCYVGANNPTWFSQKAREMKKFVEDAKSAEGRRQIVADTLAEMQRQGWVKKE